LYASAFDSTAEADLVGRLREQALPLVLLVAEDDGAITGHIAFSPAELSRNPALQIMALGPMAVSPAHQRKGVGSTLVREGLQRCRELGAGAVVVVGHRAYYPRFGFLPASRFGLACEYDVPEDVFMVAELQPGYLRDAAGTVRYHAAFDGL
jgi:putative acetyltransferase